MFDVRTGKDRHIFKLSVLGRDLVEPRCRAAETELYCKVDDSSRNEPVRTLNVAGLHSVFMLVQILHYHARTFSVTSGWRAQEVVPVRCRSPRTIIRCADFALAECHC